MTQEVLNLIRPRRPVRTILLPARDRTLEIDANRCASIVIDMQNDFISQGGWFDVRNVDAAPAKALFPKINSMTRLSRQQQIPVIWLNWGVRPDLLNVHPAHRRLVKPDPGDASYAPRMQNGKGPVLEPGTWGAAIAPELEVAPEDIHVAKHRYSGFWDNELDSVLRNLDVTTLFVAGINLDRCVLATVMDACHAGYDVVLLDDATTTHSPQYCIDASLLLVDRCFGFVSDLPALRHALASQPGQRAPSHQSRADAPL